MGTIDEARYALVDAVIEYLCSNCRAAAYGVERDSEQAIVDLEAEATRFRYARARDQVVEESMASWAFDSHYAEEARAVREQELEPRVAEAQAEVDGIAKKVDDIAKKSAVSVRRWKQLEEHIDLVRHQYPDAREEALRRYQPGDSTYDLARQARDAVDAAARDLLRAKGVYA